MTYKTSATANADLFELYRHGVAIFGVTVADDYLSGLLDVFDLIAATPFLGKARPEYDPPTRVHHHRQHSIYYEIEDEDVVIVRVLHVSRDWLRNL